MKKAILTGLLYCVWIIGSAFWYDHRPALPATGFALFVIDFVAFCGVVVAVSIFLYEDSAS